MTKRGLVFVAHGSHNLASNDKIKQLTKELKKALKDQYSFVNYAFLEFTTPSIRDAIKFQIENGSTTIVLFPFFLSMGNHVSKDIPDIIDAAKKGHPDVIFKILRPFGSYQEIFDLIIQVLRYPIK